MTSDATGRSSEGVIPMRDHAFGVRRRVVRGRRARWPRRRTWAWLLSALLVLLVVLHAFVVETFTVPSGSMEPTYRPGARIIVDKMHRDAQRGDVIVFSGADVFYESAPRHGVLGVLDTVAGLLGFRPDEQDYLKRVIGVGGDRVSVGHDGHLRVNGAVVDEPYLPPARRRASAQPFSVTVPAGHYFVLGDNRDVSDDSRNHLGDAGGGYVPRAAVIGTVAATYWKGN